MMWQLLTSFPNYIFLWFWISTKRCNSHGHSKCIKKPKFTPRNWCWSAIMLLSIYSMLTTTNRDHCVSTIKIQESLNPLYCVFSLGQFCRDYLGFQKNCLSGTFTVSKLQYSNIVNTFYVQDNTSLEK